MPLLEVSQAGRNIAESFSLRDISFQLERGQRLGMAGATGSGKSTLLKLIAGLDDTDAGAVYFDAEKVRGPKFKLIPGHPGIAYLSQHYELRNHHRMEELLSYANTMTEEKAMQLFGLCRITHLLQRNTFQLSGGEKQRIALARLLLTAPRLLILDEPFSNLDLIHKSILKSVLEDIGRELGLTTVIASHDPQDILSWADKIIILKEGKLLQEDSPMDLYFRPVDEYAGALLGKYNLLDEDTASLFDLQPAVKDRRIFIRAEHFSIVPEGHEGVEGVIEKITFWGSYYELKIRMATGRVSIITTGIDYDVAEKVYIKPKQATGHWTL